MLLELTEVLRCPRDHEESFVVCVAYESEGRHVVRGVVGCPHCQAEFPIREGILDLREPPGDEGRGAAPDEGGWGRDAEASTTGAPPNVPAPPHEHERAAAGDLTAEALATFLDLRGPGGYVVLAGGAARLAGAFAALAPGVHVVVVNPPPGLPPAERCSWVVSPRLLPLKASQVRGIALGADCATAPWPAEAVRVLLRGLRVVIEDERASPDGIAELARGAGVFVGAKSGR
jgi:uncharacterized protein YbaR (Trm112 family)